MAGDMEKEQRAERFRLIKPAVIPKSLQLRFGFVFIFYHLALSLGSAVGGVVLREMLDSSFHHVSDLKKSVKIPVLIAIPQIVTREGSILSLSL